MDMVFECLATEEYVEEVVFALEDRQTILFARLVVGAPSEVP